MKYGIISPEKGSFRKESKLANIILKRILPSIIGLAIVVLGCLWLYGFIGVKAGWIGPTEVPGLNVVSHSGAEAAGGVTAAAKAKIGL